MDGSAKPWRKRNDDDEYSKRWKRRDERYTFEKYIGRGGMAVVELWRKKWGDEELVIAKRVYLGEMDTEEEEKTRNESQYLKRLQHPHIVRYYGSWVNKETNDLLIIQEYCGGGDLAKFIKATIPKKQLVSAEKVLRWLAQLTHALLYCHKTIKILHRDLKPSNVFLTGSVGQEDVRLGDFGVATILSSTQSLCGTVIGTQVYMSPEILRMQKYGLKTDVWGLGVIMYELCTQKRPFHTSDPIAVIRAIVASERPPPFGRPPYGSVPYPAEMEALCFAMLQKDVDARPTLSQLLLEHSNLRAAVLDVERRCGWEESLVPVPGVPLGRIEEEQFSESCPTHRSEAEDEEEEAKTTQEQSSSAEVADASTSKALDKYKGQSEYEIVLQAFQRFDVNDDGLIDCQELGDVLSALDPDMWDDPLIQELFKSIDVDSDGRIQLEEWLAWVFESERGRSWLTTDTSPINKASQDSEQKTATSSKKGLNRFAEEAKARLLCGTSLPPSRPTTATQSTYTSKASPATSPSTGAERTEMSRVAADPGRNAAAESKESAITAAADISDIRELTLRQKEFRQLLASAPEYAPRSQTGEGEEDEMDQDDSSPRVFSGAPPQISSESLAGLAPPSMPPIGAAPCPQLSVKGSACEIDNGASSCWTCPVCDEPNKLRKQCNNCGAPRPGAQTTAGQSRAPQEESASSSCWTCPACDEPNKRREKCNNCGAPRPQTEGGDARPGEDKERMTRKVSIIDARLSCIEAMQGPGEPDPAELTLALRKARENELGDEDCGQALISHTVRLCVKAEDTIEKEDAHLPEIERSTELLETVQTEVRVPEEVVQRANERLQRAQEDEKQLGLRCVCGPIVRRVTVRRDCSFLQVMSEVARRWGRPVEALKLTFRYGGSSLALETEAQWKDCLRVHPRGPVELVVNMPKKAPVERRAARQKTTLRSIAAQSKAGMMSKTAPGRIGTPANASRPARGARS